jgi:hypothetical protein
MLDWMLRLLLVLVLVEESRTGRFWNTVNHVNSVSSNDRHDIRSSTQSERDDWTYGQRISSTT